MTLSAAHLFWSQLHEQLMREAQDLPPELQVRPWARGAVRLWGYGHGLGACV